MGWGGPKKRGKGWGGPGAGGWSAGTEQERGLSLSHVIYTITEVIKGGVIRYAKQSWDDLTRVGFWLGVANDGVPRFHIGTAEKYLLWDGADLSIVGGTLHLPTVSVDEGGLCIVEGDDVANQLRFVDVNGEATASVQGYGNGSRCMAFATGQPAAAGQVSRLSFDADGDMGAAVGMVLETVKGGGPASAKWRVYIGNQLRWEVGADGPSAAGCVLVDVADAAADTDALNRRAGDARYLGKAAGWSGTFATGDGRTVTLVNGQVTGIA